jgi:hypothetical protein
VGIVASLLRIVRFSDLLAPQCAAHDPNMGQLGLKQPRSDNLTRPRCPRKCSPLGARWRSPIPFYRQIYSRIIGAVLDGRLAPGARLPSARSLAPAVIARGTVETAHQLLAGEGHIVARGAAGTLVAPTLDRKLWSGGSFSVPPRFRPPPQPRRCARRRSSGWGSPPSVHFRIRSGRACSRARRVR